MRSYILGSILTLLLIVVSASAEAVNCSRDEQKGCLSIQVLNLLWDNGNPLMKGLNVSPASEKARYDRVVNTGPRLYKAWKGRKVGTAPPRKVTIYFWNVNDTFVSQIGEIRYAAMVPGNVKGRLFTAREISPRFGAVFDSMHDLGEPIKAFQVTLQGFATVLSIPWSMVKRDTYILICPNGRDTVVPNRITASNGYWITPEFLAEVRRRKWDYILMPVLSLPFSQ